MLLVDEIGLNIFVGKEVHCYTHSKKETVAWNTNTMLGNEALHRF
jgi:hypothetical protein